MSSNSELDDRQTPTFATCHGPGYLSNIAEVDGLGCPQILHPKDKDLPKTTARKYWLLARSHYVDDLDGHSPAGADTVSLDAQFNTNIIHAPYRKMECIDRPSC